MKRQTQITIETHRIIRISGRNRIFCERCRAATTPLTTEQIAAFFQITPGDVERRIETGRFHLNEAAGGRLVCGDSIK